MERLQNPSRVSALRERVESLARQLGPGAKLPKILDLCATLGVSAQTLSRVLGDMEADGWVVRKHAVGVFVSDAARPGARGRVLLLCHPGFLTQANHSPFWDILLAGVSGHAASRDGEFELAFTRPDDDGEVPDALRVDIASGKIAGVLGIGTGRAVRGFLEEHRVPFVAFAGPATHVVEIAPGELVRAGVAALSSRGCRRLELWASILSSRSRWSNGQEVEHWREHLDAALRDNGLPLQAGSVRHLRPEVEALAQNGALLTNQEQGFEIARRAFANDNFQHASARPDGVLITDDMAARGALTALAQMNVQIGSDLHVATHANTGSDVLLGFAHQVTRVEYDPQALVTAMFATLNALMRGDEVAPGGVVISPRVFESGA